MGSFALGGEASHRAKATSCMLSNSGECDMQARSYNDATAPIDLKQIRKKEYDQ